MRQPGWSISTPTEVRREGSTDKTNSNKNKGNPVSCAIASAVLDVIENEKLIQHADYIGNILLEGARQLAEKYKVNC